MNKIQIKKTVILLLLLVLFTNQVYAQDIINSLSTNQLEQTFKSEGYSYTVDDDRDIWWRLEGETKVVYRSVKGSRLSFKVWIKNAETSLSKINEWNKSKVLGRSYLDDDGDPVLQVDLDLDGGVTEARIKDFLYTCSLLFVAWRTEVL